MTQHRFTVKYKVTAKIYPGNHQWKPKAIIRPHLIIGQSLEIAPKRISFVCLNQSSRATIRNKYRAVKAVTVLKLKIKFSPFFNLMRSDPYLLLSFTNSGFIRSFARLKTPTRCIDFTSAKSSLFPDQQQLITLPDKTERSRFARNPIGPVHEGDILSHRGTETRRKIKSFTLCLRASVREISFLV